MQVGLGALAPLARRTGGALHHHVLGAYPKDERARLADALIRALTQQVGQERHPHPTAPHT